MQYRTSANYSQEIELPGNMLDCEVYDLVNEPSQTIPDETLGIKEILYRFTNGIIPNMQEGRYDRDDISIDDDVDPLNDSELSLSDLHSKMQLHYDRYIQLRDEDMKRLEQSKKPENEVISQE